VDSVLLRTRTAALGAGWICAIVLCGCANLAPSQLTLPGQDALPARGSFVCEQLVVHGDVPLTEYKPLFDELAAQRSEIYRRLGLSSPKRLIDVYLFDGKERFDEFMRRHHPEFPCRRAFFIETASQLTIYAQLGDRMADDLRHEVTHAYLHSAIPDIPLWLDEGLAKYYEAPRNQHGLNRPLWQRFQERVSEKTWQPDLRRLEKFPSTYNMTQDDYVEAWAWVHFLLESHPAREGLLKNYLSELQSPHHNACSPISKRLAIAVDQPETALTTHLGSLTPPRR
jgi:hypothetical protein